MIQPSVQHNQIQKLVTNDFFLQVKFEFLFFGGLFGHFLGPTVVKISDQTPLDNGTLPNCMCRRDICLLRPNSLH
jgi:hypothetical protein